MASLKFLSLLAGVLMAWGPFQEAAAGRRVALTVGISDYVHSPKLANPRRDAAGMSRILRALAFEVIESQDPDLHALIRALEVFYTKAEGAEAALFFYAGHGLQLDSTNYLVPKDAGLRSVLKVKQETIALQDIIEALEARAAITLVFLDACRDNPLAEALARNIPGAGRSAAVPRGLAPMTLRAPGTLVVFAAAPGKTAADGTGTNSPFTTALLRHIPEPGVEIELTMKRVTRDVAAATGGEQVPERLSRLTAEFVFNPGGSSFEDTPLKDSVLPAGLPPCSRPSPPLDCLWRRPGK